MVRTNKPYQRPDAHRKGNPDAPGSWKHDMHESVKQSLASRLSSSSSSTSKSSSSKPSLLSRMTGGAGKELLPSSNSGPSKTKLHGFDGPVPANIHNNPNAGVELLPSGAVGGGRRPKKSGRGVNTQSRDLVNAALGAGPQRFREPRRPADRELLRQSQSQPQHSHVFIMGAARGTTWVRVENLAVGTSAEDVVSAFAPLNILDAKLTPPTNPNTVTVDLEVEQRSDAEGLIAQYHGVVADGNTLQVTIVNQGLKSRMGAGARGAHDAGHGGDRQSPAYSSASGQRTSGSAAGQELLGGSSSGKLYSDTILASNPTSSIVTLSDGTSVAVSDVSRNAAARRSDAWSAGAPNLASRIGAGGRR
ncbi:hypothetical protein I317_05047 [Kwoniella heveanensis CBS 569]|nr:hypothetical protein I317_05047 [Kwoniella heveanensis CBS 569]